MVVEAIAKLTGKSVVWLMAREIKHEASFDF
jgi:hypothetical protein